MAVRVAIVNGGYRSSEPIQSWTSSTEISVKVSADIGERSQTLKLYISSSCWQASSPTPILLILERKSYFGLCNGLLNVAIATLWDRRTPFVASPYEHWPTCGSTSDSNPSVQPSSGCIYRERDFIISNRRLPYEQGLKAHPSIHAVYIAARFVVEPLSIKGYGSRLRD